jgi:hypothetical protein
MATRNDYHGHWIQGNLDERLIMTAILAMVGLSSVLALFFW